MLRFTRVKYLLLKKDQKEPKGTKRNQKETKGNKRNQKEPKGTKTQKAEAIFNKILGTINKTYLELISVLQGF